MLISLQNHQTMSGENETTSRRRLTLEEWELSWQENWRKVGMPEYELPVGGPGGMSANFSNWQLLSNKLPDKT